MEAEISWKTKNVCIREKKLRQITGPTIYFKVYKINENKHVINYIKVEKT